MRHCKKEGSCIKEGKGFWFLGGGEIKGGGFPTIHLQRSNGEPLSKRKDGLKSGHKTLKSQHGKSKVRTGEGKPRAGIEAK